MSEKVVVHQKIDFDTAIWSADPEADEPELHPAIHISDITPYGMLLAGLGSCTAVVVNTYAQYHNVDLREVAVTLEYQRKFREDCEQCEQIERYEEQIDMSIEFKGSLTPQMNEKLFRIAQHCPIHKIFNEGIHVEFHLAQPHTPHPASAVKKT